MPDREVWVTQGGASPASALKICLPPDGHVSDALRESAKLFMFNGAMVPPGELAAMHRGVPLHNRTRLSDVEADATNAIDLVIERPARKMDFVEFYGLYYPQLLPAVPAILQRYSGRAGALWDTLLARQGLTQATWEDALSKSLAKMHTRHAAPHISRNSSLRYSLHSLTSPSPLTHSLPSVPLQPAVINNQKIDELTRSLSALPSGISDSVADALFSVIQAERPLRDANHLAVPAHNFPNAAVAAAAAKLSPADADASQQTLNDTTDMHDADSLSSECDACMSTVDMKKRLHSLTSSSVKGTDSIKNLLAAVGVTQMTEDKMTRMSPRGFTESFFRQHKSDKRLRRVGRGEHREERRRSVSGPGAVLTPMQESEQRKRLRRISDCDVSSTQAMRTLLSNSCTTVTDLSITSASPRQTDSVGEHRCSPIEAAGSGGERFAVPPASSRPPQPFHERSRSAASVDYHYSVSTMSPYEQSMLASSTVPVIVPEPPSPPCGPFLDHKRAGGTSPLSRQATRTDSPTPDLDACMAPSPHEDPQEDVKLPPPAASETEQQLRLSVRDADTSATATPIISPESDARCPHPAEGSQLSSGQLDDPAAPASAAAQRSDSAATKDATASAEGAATDAEASAEPEAETEAAVAGSAATNSWSHDVERMATMPVLASPSSVPRENGAQRRRHSQGGSSTTHENETPVPLAFPSLDHAVARAESVMMSSNEDVVAAAGAGTTTSMDEHTDADPLGETTRSGSSGSTKSGEDGSVQTVQVGTAREVNGVAKAILPQSGVSRTSENDCTSDTSGALPRQGSLRRESGSRLTNAKVTINSDQECRSSRRGSFGLPPTTKRMRGGSPALLDSIRDTLSGIPQLPTMKGGSPALETPQSAPDSSCDAGAWSPASPNCALPLRGGSSSTSATGPVDGVSTGATANGNGTDSASPAPRLDVLDCRPPMSPKRPVPAPGTPASVRSAGGGAPSHNGGGSAAGGSGDAGGGDGVANAGGADAPSENARPLNLPQHVIDAINSSNGLGTQRLSIKRHAAASLKHKGSASAASPSPLAATARDMRELLASAVSTPKRQR